MTRGENAYDDFMLIASRAAIKVTVVVVVWEGRLCIGPATGGASPAGPPSLHPRSMGSWHPPVGMQMPCTCGHAQMDTARR